MLSLKPAALSVDHDPIMPWLELPPKEWTNAR